MKKSKSLVPGRLSGQARLVLWLLPPLTLLVCLCLGRIPAPPGALLRCIGAKLGLCAAPGGQYVQIFWSMRLPRLLLAILVGAGLSVAGCVFQSLFANPLATPDTLGVASGGQLRRGPGPAAGLWPDGPAADGDGVRHRRRRPDLAGSQREKRRAQPHCPGGHYDRFAVFGADLAFKIRR